MKESSKVTRLDAIARKDLQGETTLETKELVKVFSCSQVKISPCLNNKVSLRAPRDRGSHNI